MGEVYRADDLGLGQSVALKFLPERVAADESWLRRFRNEVRTARQVAHPNLCRIYDIGQEDGHVFLSMEYIDGEDLSSVLRRLGRPTREKAVEIARQICLGLAAAHENNVLHRDLKPANIMIDGRGRVRITDFGLAGFLDDLEGAEARAGTPAYMAPEQLVHGRVSARSDIYSLGLILYELFTGRSAFDTNDVEELKRRHSSGSVSTPSSISDEIDLAVERIVMRCLERDPAQRPQSVYQVLAALPGGDPLAAALAAGELPSPELVANARDAGGLRPAVAVALLISTLVSITINYFISTETTVMPEQSPARLSVVAEQVMETLGFDDLPRYSVSGYDVNLGWVRSPHKSPMSADQIRELGWPPRYRYWRRWSDATFLPSDMHFPEQFTIDGPTDDPDRTATVALDSTGRLIELIVPPGFVEPGAATTDDIDWLPLFECAHLDPAEAERVTSDAKPHIYCDAVVAWRVKTSAEARGTVTVLTGAVNAHPNYFEYVGLGEAMMPDHADWQEGRGIRRLCRLLFDVLMALLAVRNLRTGRADRRNAMRCALFVGGLYTLMEIVSISVGGSDPVVRVLQLMNQRAAGHILIHIIHVWVYYLAIEPYVRRIWPRMLIGLVRVLSGRWRDPAIGREVLIGQASACALVAILTLVSVAELRLTNGNAAHFAHAFSLRIIPSPGHYLSNLAHDTAWAVLSGVSYAGFVVLIRVLVRHPTASTCLSVAAIGFLEFPMYFGNGGISPSGAVVHAVAIGVILVWLYTRVGVLSAMAFFFVMRSMTLFVLAFDDWSTPYLVAWLATLLAIAGYAFWISLAGQPLFRDILAEPQST